MFTFQVNLRNVCDNIPDVARTGALDHKERPTERRRLGYKKSVTVDLQALMVEKYLREKVNRRTLLVDRLQKINNSIQTISEALISVASVRSVSVNKFFNHYLIPKGRQNGSTSMLKTWRR